MPVLYKMALEGGRRVSCFHKKYGGTTDWKTYCQQGMDGMAWYEMVTLQENLLMKFFSKRCSESIFLKMWNDQLLFWTPADFCSLHSIISTSKFTSHKILMDFCSFNHVTLWRSCSTGTIVSKVVVLFRSTSFGLKTPCSLMIQYEIFHWMALHLGYMKPNRNRGMKYLPTGYSIRRLVHQLYAGNLWKQGIEVARQTIEHFFAPQNGSKWWYYISYLLSHQYTSACSSFTRILQECTYPADILLGDFIRQLRCIKLFRNNGITQPQLV